MYQDDFYSNELCRQYALSFSNRVKQSIRAKRKRGGWCGKAPRGYRNIHDNNDHFKCKIVRDPKYYGRIRRAFRLMLTGEYSVAEIGKIVEMDASFLRRAFKNPFYAGLNKDVDDPTVLNKGTWEPMITEDAFNTIQKMLESKKKPNGKTSKR